MTDQNSGITRCTYDEANRMKTLTDPQNKITTYNYDPASNLSSVLYPNSTQADYTFDTLNRLLTLTNKKASGAVLSSYTYQYDEVSRRKKVTLADATTVDFGYDKTSQLTSEVRAGSNPYSLAYTYDKAGNRLSQARGSGITLLKKRKAPTPLSLPMTMRTGSPKLPTMALLLPPTPMTAKESVSEPLNPALPPTSSTSA